MALATTKHRVASATVETPQEALSIEAARRQYRPGSLELVVAELGEMERLAEIAREHKNAENRQGTKVKAALRSYALETGMEGEDQILIGDTAYSYDVTHSEKISVEGLYKMLKDGEITDGEFLRCVTVSKGDAAKVIGEHKLLKITKIEAGKKLDVRSNKLDQPVKRPTLVQKSKRIEQKLNTASQEAPPVKTLTSRNKLALGRKLKIAKKPKIKLRS